MVEEEVKWVEYNWCGDDCMAEDLLMCTAWMNWQETQLMVTAVHHKNQVFLWSDRHISERKALTKIGLCDHDSTSEGEALAKMCLNGDHDMSLGRVGVLVW